jgi:predicted DNA-binding WGR domain protein
MPAISADTVFPAGFKLGKFSQPTDASGAAVKDRLAKDASMPPKGGKRKAKADAAVEEESAAATMATERPSIAPDAVAKMSVAALKEELSARGIDATGNKAALVARLTEALEKPPPEMGGGEEKVKPPKGGGKGKAKADAAVEDEPAAKKPKTEKVEKKRKKPIRRPDHGELIYCVEYAASNRSTCKECQQKIEKDELRLGHTIPGKGDYDNTSWTHVNCHMQPLEVSEEETLTSASQIEWYDELEKTDQKKLDAWFAKASKMPKKPVPTIDAADEDALPGTPISATFKEREEIAGMGGRFDYRTRTWFIPFSADATPFAKWLGADAAATIAAHNAADPAERVAGGSTDAPAAAAAAEGEGSKGKAAADRFSRPAAVRAPNVHGRRVDSGVPEADAYSVYSDYDVKLSEASIVDGANVNKYYFCQVLEKTGGGFATYFKWGKVGEKEYGDQLKPFDELKDAIQSFEAKFNEKTRGKKDKSPPGEAWAAYKAGNFEKRDRYYGVIETKASEAGAAAGEDDWQKSLDDKQIQKGITALEAIKAALLDQDQAQDKALIAKLSTEYYRAIPTSSGRKAPPPLDSLQIVGEKLKELEFWLRMGFEDMTELLANPIKELWDTPLQPTLSAACEPYGVSDKYSITSSVSRGNTLAKKKAGGPIKKMNGEMYGAIVLYTGNSCYRQLNQALRLEHKEVPKYMSYLRLLFEATVAMPTAKVRLWRGIAADLYDEYEPGKVIVWWSVSSTTAKESVARGFMSQLGGVASLIILDTKSAINITPLSIYPNEAESLLMPGTRLKVISRERVGKVNEIHVEEVDSAVEPPSAQQEALRAAAGAAAAAAAAEDDAEEDKDHPYSWFTVELAKSNRSKCKGCFEPIALREVRIGCELEDLDGAYGGHTITEWRHVKCCEPKWIKKLDQLQGFKALKGANKTIVEEWHAPAATKEAPEPEAKKKKKK